MKIYVFAGPNGSGKSTTVEKFIAANALDNIAFLNPDILAKKHDLFKDIPESEEKYVAIRKYCDSKMDELLKQKKDFAFESVFSHPSKLDFLKEAKKQGAEICVVYVLTTDKEINVRRVDRRVKEGGHPVPLDKIRERYDRCIKLLPELLDISNQATVYNNSVDNALPKVMLNKKDDSIMAISSDPQSDIFLTDVMINPLSEKGYKIFTAKQADLDGFCA